MRTAWRVGVLLGLVGCSWLWDAGHRDEASHDLHAVLEARGLDWSLRSCHMVGTTRSFTCTTRLSEATVDAVRGPWGMARVGLEDVALGGRCTGLAARPEAHIWAPSGADPLSDTSLTGFVLVWDARSGEACVGATRRYG